MPRAHVPTEPPANPVPPGEREGSKEHWRRAYQDEQRARWAMEDQQAAETAASSETERIRKRRDGWTNEAVRSAVGAVASAAAGALIGWLIGKRGR